MVEVKVILLACFGHISIKIKIEKIVSKKISFWGKKMYRSMAVRVGGRGESASDCVCFFYNFPWLSKFLLAPNIIIIYSHLKY